MYTVIIQQLIISSNTRKTVILMLNSILKEIRSQVSYLLRLVFTEGIATHGGWLFMGYNKQQIMGYYGITHITHKISMNTHGKAAKARKVAPKLIFHWT